MKWLYMFYFDMKYLIWYKIFWYEKMNEINNLNEIYEINKINEMNEINWINNEYINK